MQALNRLVIKNPPKTNTEDSDSVNHGTASAKGNPLIKFARFVNGTLELFEAKTDELDYIAFSHVWPDIERRKVPGISYEVKVSQEKADFIKNDLPGLVGSGAFWMDTLTVDQRNEEEVMAIVESIPTIFGVAERTIAVRENDGLYDCCMRAVERFRRLRRTQ